MLMSRSRASRWPTTVMRPQVMADRPAPIKQCTKCVAVLIGDHQRIHRDGRTLVNPVHMNVPDGFDQRTMKCLTPSEDRQQLHGRAVKGGTAGSDGRRQPEAPHATDTLIIVRRHLPSQG